MASIHEAGHCFAAFRFGVPILAVGLCRTKITAVPKGETDCILLLAGLAAERVLTGGHTTHGSSDDWITCEEKYKFGPQQMGRLLDKATDLIQENRDVVDQIARKLCKETCLYETEIATIVTQWEKK